MTPERIAELRKELADHCEYKWAACCELSECLAEIEKRQAVDDMLRRLLKEAAARVAQLEAALKPFVAIDHNCPPYETIVPYHDERTCVACQLGAELNAARAAMEETA